MADKTKIFETDRLLLRKFEETDAESIFKNFKLEIA